MRSVNLPHLESYAGPEINEVPFSPSCHSNRSRFEELALPLLTSVHNRAYFLSRSKADAEDLVQDTYLKALRGFYSFEPGSNFRAWMFQILRNTFFNSRKCADYRQRHLHTSLDELMVPLQSRFPDPAETLLCRHRFLAIRFAIQRLTSVQRSVFVLCDLEEASYREAAEVLSIPVGTVMSRLARARKAVRSSVQDHVIYRRVAESRNPEIN